MGFISATKKVITTQRSYTADEVCERLRQRGGLPFEAKTRQYIGAKGVVIPGSSTNYVMILVSRDKITVTHKATFAAALFLGAIGAGIIESINAKKNRGIDDRWAATVGRTRLKIDDIVYAVADRLEYLLANPGAAAFPAL